ncbi:unnamed protein product [Closterium sp. Yama58-4]|nr:unnamed protein product [Closterium sp. Yama58-4]
MGSWLFTVLLTGVVLLGTAEYFNLINARAKLNNVAVPSRLSVYIGCIGCAIMPLIAMVNGGLLTPGVKFAGGLLLAMLLTQPKRPRWSQFTGYVCGLFYCGFLPSFWVTLRCGVATTATTSSPVARLWPALLGGPALWTTGLVATFMGFAGVIAADTGAYLGGKNFGKTPLSELSPKKTVEGALFGLASSVSVSVLLSHAFSWPATPISAAVLGVIVFASSLFGDLFESALKRQAGVKDAGSLIPGHGGILDRTDSYIFTAPAIYLFIRYGSPRHEIEISDSETEPLTGPRIAGDASDRPYDSRDRTCDTRDRPPLSQARREVRRHDYVPAHSSRDTGTARFGERPGVRPGERLGERSDERSGERSGGRFGEEGGLLETLGQEIVAIVTPVSICMLLVVALVLALTPHGASVTTPTIATLVYQEERYANHLTSIAVTPGCMPLVLAPTPHGTSVTTPTIATLVYQEERACDNKSSHALLSLFPRSLFPASTDAPWQRLWGGVLCWTRGSGRAGGNHSPHALVSLSPAPLPSLPHQHGRALAAAVRRSVKRSCSRVRARGAVLLRANDSQALPFPSPTSTDAPWQRLWGALLNAAAMVALVTAATFVLVGLFYCCPVDSPCANQPVPPLLSSFHRPPPSLFAAHTSTDAPWQRLWGALLNAAAMVALVTAATFVLVGLFYCGCARCIWGYMGFSGFVIFAGLGGTLAVQLIQVSVRVAGMGLCMWVGLVNLFYCGCARCIWGYMGFSGFVIFAGLGGTLAVQLIQVRRC